MHVFEQGDRVTVHRSSGAVEDDWYVHVNGAFFHPFAAPEVVLVLVVKPQGGLTYTEGVAANADCLEKKVTLLELLEWNGKVK